MIPNLFILFYLFSLGARNAACFFDASPPRARREPRTEPPAPFALLPSVFCLGDEGEDAGCGASPLTFD